MVRSLLLRTFRHTSADECPACPNLPQGDEEDTTPKYVYEGARAAGETQSITAGEAPKVMTKEIELLGQREGAGKATFPQGDVYEGEFLAGARDGAGKYVYAAPPPGEEEEPKPPIAEYDGQWAQGAKARVGTATYASGHKYQGSWKNGKFSDLGTMFYPNGDIFTGMWSEGKKSGQGTYIFKASGTKVAGEWKDNALVTGAFVDAFGNTYTGTFSGDAAQCGFVAGGAFTLASGATDVAF